MKKIITISREFGSGGRTIAKLVAKDLGFSYYDKELIDMAAKDSGLSPEFIEKTEQNLSSGWLYNILLGSSYSSNNTSLGKPILPLADQVFNAQRKVILDIATKGNCVIVGRCADFILKTSSLVDNNDLLNVFIYSDMAYKIKRATTEYNVPEKDAERIITTINKRRANHYNTFTDNIWGDRTNYDLLINSSLKGIEETAKIISGLAK